MDNNKNFKVQKAEEEWKQILTPFEYHILREKGTEGAGSSKLNKMKDEGIFVCKACGHKVFDSKAKYDSGSGWPSFYQPLEEGAVQTEVDNSHFMERVEVHCSNCGSHFGHVFDDGPKETTGQRFCINGAALNFIPKDEISKKEAKKENS
jgi:peptide-methionine (R)-S-oxide reductase